MSKEKLQWHPAFAAALRITLSEEMQYLELQEEYLLSKAPPKIDILVVKKRKEIAIQKKIGRIFRGHNIIEYKSPEDSLSVNDFYKVYGYTCFYQSNTDHVKEIDPEDMTITFVSNCYPREMFRHLKKVRNITVERQSKGIYYLEGDAIPMQYLNLKELVFHPLINSTFWRAMYQQLFLLIHQCHQDCISNGTQSVLHLFLQNICRYDS